MKIVKKYLLRSCDQFGHTTTLEQKTGHSLPLFTRKKDAEAYATENPNQFPTGYFKAEEVCQLVPQDTDDEEEEETD